MYLSSSEMENGEVITPVGVVKAIFVPQLCANLLSVSELNRRGAGVHFLPTPQKSEIRFNGERFGVSLVGNLYQVDEACCYLSTENIADLWHQRLGHLNFPAVVSYYLKRFGINISQPNSSFCRICAEATIRQRNYKLRNSLDLISGKVHSDIGGPVEESHKGFKYWITLIFEDNKYIKVEFLKKKSDAVNKILFVLKKFQTRGVGIAIFRSDGGPEYQSIKIQDFFQQTGVEHT